MKLRIEMAIVRAKEQGKRVLKKEIAAKLWPDASEQAQQVNMTNLCNGKTIRVEPEWICTIAEMCGCTADYLLGMSNN